MSSDDRHESKWSIAAYLIRERRLGWGMVIGGGIWALIGLSALRIQCPFLQVTGHPCPGCGLTRATFAMFRGDWKSMLRFHPFAPVFAVFWVVVILGLICPRAVREKVLAQVDRLERITRWPLIVGAGLLVYSLTRWFGICYFPTD